MSNKGANSKVANLVLDEVRTLSNTHGVILPAHVATSIGKGIKQYESGQTISLQEFTKKYLSSN